MAFGYKNHNSIVKNIEKHCEKFNECIYLGVLFIDGLYTEYLKKIKSSGIQIKKSESLKHRF